MMKITQRSLLGLAVALLLAGSLPAFAACTSPAGNAGDIAYSSTANVMAYCNGSGWINMGTSSTTTFGTLTTTDFCTATSGTGISCTTAATGSGNVVLATSPTLTSLTISSGGLTITAGGASITGTVAGTIFSGSGASLTNIGTSNMTSVTGTANSTTYLRGDNTWGTVLTGLITGITAITGGNSSGVLFNNV